MTLCQFLHMHRHAGGGSRVPDKVTAELRRRDERDNESTLVIEIGGFELEPKHTVYMLGYKEQFLVIAREIAKAYGYELTELPDEPSIRIDLDDEHIDRIIEGEKAETEETLGAVEQPIRTDLSDDEADAIVDAEGIEGRE